MSDSLSEHLKEPLDPHQLQAMIASWEHFGMPEAGWQPEDFPQITVDSVPYTSNAYPRPDPYITIRSDGWIFIEVGTIRIAMSDRQEWKKLVSMVDRMLVSWQAAQPEFDDEPLSAEEFFAASPPPPGVTEQGEDPDVAHPAD